MGGGCYIKATPERSGSAGALGGGRNGLARAGMRACGTWRQGKGSDGQQGRIMEQGWHWAGAGNSLPM